ncbi:MAG: alpha/beta fold hydrolase, partial [Kiritimatiellia bacterium]
IPTWLITGWAFPAAAWKPLLQRLPDLPRPRIFTLPELQTSAPADFAAGLVTQLAEYAQPVSLIGWSTGAMAALDAAARRPEQIRRLVLLAGTARFCRTDQYDCGCASAVLRALSRNLHRDPARALRGFLTEAEQPLSPTDLEQQVAAALQQGPASLAAGLNYLARADLRQALASIRLPALIIHGGQDRIIPRAAGEYLAHHLPRAQLHIDRQSGHNLPQQAADTLARLIRQYL